MKVISKGTDIVEGIIYYQLFLLRIILEHLKPHCFPYIMIASYLKSLPYYKGQNCNTERRAKIMTTSRYIKLKNQILCIKERREGTYEKVIERVRKKKQEARELNQNFNRNVSKFSMKKMSVPIHNQGWI